MSLQNRITRFTKKYEFYMTVEALVDEEFRIFKFHRHYGYYKF